MDEGGFRFDEKALEVFKSKFSLPEDKKPSWVTRGSYKGFKEQMKNLKFERPSDTKKSKFRDDQYEFRHKDFTKQNPSTSSIVLKRKTGKNSQKTPSAKSNDSLSSSSTLPEHPIPDSSAGQAASGELESGNDRTKLEFLEGFHAYLCGEEQEGVSVEKGFLFQLPAFEKFMSLIRLPPGHEKPKWLTISDERQFFDLMRDYQAAYELKLC